MCGPRGTTPGVGVGVRHRVTVHRVANPPLPARRPARHPTGLGARRCPRPRPSVPPGPRTVYRSLVWGPGTSVKGPLHLRAQRRSSGLRPGTTLVHLGLVGPQRVETTRTCSPVSSIVERRATRCRVGLSTGFRVHWHRVDYFLSRGFHTSARRFGRRRETRDSETVIIDQGGRRSVFICGLNGILDQTTENSQRRFPQVGE